MDTLDKLWDDYDEKYQKMADIKRTEDVSRRQKEKDQLIYRNEKRVQFQQGQIAYRTRNSNLIYLAGTKKIICQQGLSNDWDVKEGGKNNNIWTNSD